MKSFRTGTAVLAALLVAGAAAGQEGGRRPPAGQPAQQAPQEDRPQTLVSVDFPGGTVGQYIAELKQAAGAEPVNIVVSGDSAQQPMGPVSLQRVSVKTAAEAIRAAATVTDWNAWNIAPFGGSGGGSSEAYLVMYQKPTVGRTRTAPNATLQVFSIRELIEPMPSDPFGVKLVSGPEVVLTAVKTALDVVGGDGPAPEMKYHEESGVLIVHGTPEQIGAARQTLEEMRTDIARRRNAAMQDALARPQVDIAALKADAQKAEVMRMQAERDMQRQAAEVERVRKLVDAGQMSQGELAATESKLDEVKSRAQLLAIDMERARAAMDAAQAQTGAAGARKAEELQARMQALSDAIKRAQERVGVAGVEDVAGAREQVQALVNQREQARVELDTLEAVSRVSKDQASNGKSVAAYDVPAMDAKARDQLNGMLAAMVAAVNDPSKLKVQTDESSHRIVVEADGTIQQAVGTLIKEVAGARGSKESEPKSGDSGKAKKPGR